MKKYKVIRGFFKVSEQKNYNIGDEIELNELEASLLREDNAIEDIISKKIIKK